TIRMPKSAFPAGNRSSRSSKRSRYNRRLRIARIVIVTPISGKELRRKSGASTLGNRPIAQDQRNESKKALHTNRDSSENRTRRRAFFSRFLAERRSRTQLLTSLCIARNCRMNPMIHFAFCLESETDRNQP